MNKHNKIVSYLKGRWPDIIWAHDCQEDYLEQVVDYMEKQEPDDAPDSAASLIRAEFPEAKKNYKDLYKA